MAKEFLLLLSACAVIGGILSYWSVGLLRNWTLRQGLLDIPCERSLHYQPMPRGGGLVIVLVTLSGWVAYGFLNHMKSSLDFWSYLLGALLVAVVSFMDDLCLSRTPGPKFAAQSASAVLAIVGLGYWHSISIPFLGEWSLGWLGIPLTFIWIVGLTNAFNFFDGLDGLAASLAIVMALGGLVLGLWLVQPLLILLALLLGASSLGFLGHNWPPAKIFMGDVGSTFLGYSFAVLPLMVRGSNSRLALGSILLVWPVVSDTLFTFFRRLHKGDVVFAAHRTHLYQRLVNAGQSHRFVTSLYIGWGLICLGLSVLHVLGGATLGGSAAFVVAVTAPAMWGLVKRQEKLRSRSEKSKQPKPSTAVLEGKNPPDILK